MNNAPLVICNLTDGQLTVSAIMLPAYQCPAGYCQAEVMAFWGTKLAHSIGERMLLTYLAGYGHKAREEAEAVCSELLEALKGATSKDEAYSLWLDWDTERALAVAA